MRRHDPFAALCAVILTLTAGLAERLQRSSETRVPLAVSS